MLYEAEICIRRSDPQQLVEDFQAVTELLERRKAARSSRSTAVDAVCAAQRIIDGDRGSGEI
jgi:hypothetical protein